MVVPGDVTVAPFTFDAPGAGAAMVVNPFQSATVAVTFRPTALGQVVRTLNYQNAQVTAIGTGTAKNEIDGTDGDDTLTGTPGDDVITCGDGQRQGPRRRGRRRHQVRRRQRRHRGRLRQ